ADELDRATRRASDRSLVDTRDRCAASRLAHGAGMAHAGDDHVVDEGWRAEYLAGQIEPRCGVSDHIVGGDGLARRRASRRRGEVDCGCQRPVIFAGWLAVAQDAAVR